MRRLWRLVTTSLVVAWIILGSHPSLAQPSAREAGVAPNCIPPTPTLLSPANGAFVPTRNIRLEWSAVPDTEHYRVQVSFYSNFSMTLLDGHSETTYVVLPGTYIPWVYYWHVSASTTGCPGDETFSDPWSFQVANLVYLPLVLRGAP